MDTEHHGECFGDSRSKQGHPSAREASPMAGKLGLSSIPQCHISDTLPTLETPNAGSVEKRVVPLPHLPSMVVLRTLNPSHYLNLIATISIHPQGRSCSKTRRAEDPDHKI
ncbi:hypothetical protein Bca4012_021472 [Brassica carinata]